MKDFDPASLSEVTLAMALKHWSPKGWAEYHLMTGSRIPHRLRVQLAADGLTRVDGKRGKYPN